MKLMKRSPVFISLLVLLSVALVHGRRDRLIRAGEARLLFDGAAEPRRLDVVARMGHGIDDAAREAVVGAIDWVMDVPSGEVPAANG